MEESSGLDFSLTKVAGQIIYPEVHLNSPLVLNKVVYYLRYAGIKTRYQTTTGSLEHNIERKLIDGLRSANKDYKFGRQYRGKLRRSLGGSKKWKETIYPDANGELFRYVDQELGTQAERLFDMAGERGSEMAQQVTKLLIDTLTKAGSSKLADKRKKKIPSMGSLNVCMKRSIWYLPYLTWYTIKTEFRRVIKDLTGNPHQRFEMPRRIVTRNAIYLIGQSICTIIDKRTMTYIHLSFEMVLALCDTIEGRWMIDVSSLISEEYHEINQRFHNLWAIMDSLFESCGNGLYDVVGSLEGLTLGCLQMHDPVMSLRGAFLEQVSNDIIEALVTSSGGYIDGDQATIILMEMIKNVNHKDPEVVAETMSLFRTWSHPVLEAEQAAEKVRKHMQKEKTVSFDRLLQIHAMFCAMVINGYRKQHSGTWPPCIFPGHASPQMKEAQAMNLALTYEETYDNWQSFVGFKFEKFIVPDIDSDLTIYLKDKALAPPASSWDSVFLSGSTLYKAKKDGLSRRLVDQFLADADFSPEKILNYATSGEYLEDAEMNTCYSLKEREVKTTGRLFAKMPYKMRAVQVLAEHLVSTGIGEYFYENSMVKDEITLAKSLFQLSLAGVPTTGCTQQSRNEESLGNGESPQKGRVKGDPKKENLRRQKKAPDRTRPSRGEATTMEDAEKYETIAGFITTDLEKFCLNWRNETTALFTNQMDNIYGTPGLFGWHHKVLEKLVLYVADPYCPTEHTEHKPLDECGNEGIFIQNPLGGIEGYCQKTWSIITIAAMQVAAVESGFRVTAQVQGDNQVHAVTVRVPKTLPYVEKKEEANRATGVYFDHLREIMWGIGHNLKNTETIISSDFFVFSKKIYFHGSPLKQALKSMSRCALWSETVVDETKAACSNISTAISKAIENGYPPECGYMISIMRTLQQVYISLGMTINETMTRDVSIPLLEDPELIKQICLIPAAVGGMNHLSLSRLFVRNIGDPIVAAFSDLKRMTSAGLIKKRVLSLILNQEPGSSKWVDWASDPYSGNLKWGQSITSLLKNISGRMIMARAVNPVLCDLFSEDSGEVDEWLAQFLLNRDTIIPRAASEIVDASIVGARKEIAGMIDTTKTLMKHAINKGSYSIKVLYRISNHDYLLFQHLIKMMANVKLEGTLNPGSCSVYLAQIFRSRMWMSLSKGRKILGLEVPDPIEAIEGHLSEGPIKCDDQSPYAFLYVPPDCELGKVTRGSDCVRVPYLGSKTDERSSLKVGVVKNLSSAARQGIRAAMVYTWAFGDDDEAWESALAIAQTRANFTMEELKALTPMSTSTNMSHRLQDKHTQMKYCATYRGRVARYTTISNDRLNLLDEEGRSDTNLVYQQMMLYGLSVLELYYAGEERTSEEATILHCHLVGDCCIQFQDNHAAPRQEEDHVIDLGCTQNPMIYDKEPLNEDEKKKMATRMYGTSAMAFQTWPDNYLISELGHATAATVVEIIANNEGSILKSMITTGDQESANGLITEFLNCDPRQTMISIGLQFLLRWIYSLSKTRPAGKVELLSDVHELLSNTSSQTFSFLRSLLTHRGVWNRLRSFGLVAPTSGHTLETQNFGSLITSLIVDGVRMAIEGILSGKRAALRIYETDPELITRRVAIVQTRFMMLLFTLMRDQGDKLTLYGLTQEEREKKVKETMNNLEWRQRLRTIGKGSEPDLRVYPTTTTYVRRGTIKFIRFRSLVTVADDLSIEGPTNLGRSKSPTRSSVSKVPQKTPILRVPVLLESHKGADISSLIPSSVGTGDRYSAMELRLTGVNSSSHYKMIEMIGCLDADIPCEGDVMTLGEGSGAMASVLAIRFEETRIWYNTAANEGNVNEQRENSITPSEMEIVDSNRGERGSMLARTIRMFGGDSRSTYIGEPSATRLITELTAGYRMRIITFDGESMKEKTFKTIFGEHMELINIYMARATEKGILITKFLVSENGYWLGILNLYRSVFDCVKLMSLNWSNPASGEFYVAASMAKRREPASMDPEDLFFDWGITISTLLGWMSKSKSRNRETVDRNLKDQRRGRLSQVSQSAIEMGFPVSGGILFRTLTGVTIEEAQEDPKGILRSILKRGLDEIRRPSEQVGLFEAYQVCQKTRIKQVKGQIALRVFLVAMVTRGASSEFGVSDVVEVLRWKKISISVVVLAQRTQCGKDHFEWAKKEMRELEYKVKTPLEKQIRKIKGYIDYIGE